MAIPVIAQIKTEKRIYLFDNTSSMVTLGIWEDVKKNLKNAIDNIDDPSTTIVIVPFVQHVIGIWEEKATDNGKRILKENIDAATPGGSSTNICAAMETFYQLADTNCINYMFLLTDGVHNTTPFQNLIDDLKLWSSKIGRRDIYGFYVMLHSAAHNNTIETTIASQKNLWVVKTADINVNIYRLNGQIIYNVRNDNDLTLVVEGKLKNAGNTIANLVLEENNYFDLQISQNKVKEGKIKFSLIPKISIHSIPDEINLEISVNPENAKEFTYIVPETIYLKCINKKEKALKISLK